MRNIFLNLLGILVLLTIVYLCSDNRKSVSIRFIFKCIASQLIIAFLLINTDIGIKGLQIVGDVFGKLVSFASFGLRFVFGKLADPSQNGPIFAINVLGAIVFLGALSSLLNYLKVIPFVISFIGRLFQKGFKSTPLDTFVCISNMFFGQSDAALFIKDYLGKATRAECLTVFIAGMGSVSITILGGYVSMGIPANILLIAIGLVPISSLLFSKILIPESSDAEKNKPFEIKYSTCSSVLDSIVTGARDGGKIAISVGATLIAFVAFISLFNALFTPIFGLTIEECLSKLFYPFVYLYGLDQSNLMLMGELFSTKLILNEFIAYAHLTPFLQGMDPRTVTILVVSLCGFANIGNIGIMISALSALCPERHALYCSLGLKGLLGGFCVGLLNGFIVSLVCLI